MSRTAAMAYLVGRLTQVRTIRSQAPRLCFSTTLQAESLSEHLATGHCMEKENRKGYQRPLGENISRREKIKFLVNALLELDDSKEAVYGTLDAWVAWEQNFPIASLKNVLLALEKEQQWHRVVQVIKWTLSKGQGNTMGTYRQLIRALDMDHRAEEAHKIWVKKIGYDLHSVPWQLCNLMISVYYRNNMLESLVKLFKDLEAFDRKPPEKLIVRKVANAYEILGLIDEKERILEKYSDLFNETRKEAKKKSKKAKSLKKEQTPGNVDTVTDVMDGTQAD
ncbi:hypothetical protein Nepgr_011507 [Nepenthes gracilis]|uniref:Pentatricopeptide repeat-containing protein n=1 Tax=Nepenthes gracilis TaxID=150966 RepID=A0AAD3SF96_NEPGR|nr:hypothetical protein Nepgr_011507 [Nepenthes gracilis]